jgi:hypothetical protein
VRKRHESARKGDFGFFSLVACSGHSASRLTWKLLLGLPRENGASRSLDRQVTRATISEHAAKELTEGAQPVSGASIILRYQGKIYIVPDKKMSDERMASDMVKSLAAK